MKLFAYSLLALGCQGAVHVENVSFELHADMLSVNLVVEGQQVMYNLSRSNIFANDANTTLRNGTIIAGTEIEHGTFTSPNNDVVFTIFKDGRITGSVTTDPNAPFEIVHSTTAKHRALGNRLDMKHAYQKIYLSELKEGSKCGSVTAGGDTKEYHAVGRHLASFPQPVFPGKCYYQDDRPHTLTAGFILDKAMTDKFGNDAVSVLTNTLAIVNGYYKRQYNLEWKIGALVQHSPDFTQCGSTLNELLGQVKAYGAKSTTPVQSAYMRISGCKLGGGLAYIGTICRSAGHNSGVIIVEEKTPATITLAHELGHITGAVHSFEHGEGTTGGIMDYGNGILHGTGQVGFGSLRQPEMCGGLQQSKQSIEACPKMLPTEASKPRCGDKYVSTPGEECECANGTTRCAGCTKCKLDHHVQCSSTFFMNPSGLRQPGGIKSLSECCSSNGKFVEAGKLCSLPGGIKGKCVNGNCEDPCFSSGLKYCGETSDSCTVECGPFDGSRCSKYYGKATGGLAGALRDGTYCKTSSNSNGMCNRGVCKAS
mmetsp:Transcript_36308/g.58137  ORF Transcript_36308/g.58137 Transcript_36308/m.58137 type:complete len:539 (-) Transcript_36308:3253-4869(-)